MSVPQREDEHVRKALDLLTGAYKDKPVIEGLLTAFVNRVQDLEHDVWILVWAWVLDYAVESRLDDLGAIVGEKREGREDDDYRTAIRIRIRVNRSKGRSEDMVQVLALISALATYIEMFPLGWEASLYNITNGGDVIRYLTQAKAAGSYGVLLSSTWDEDNVFKFDYLDGQSVTSSKLDYTVAAEVGYKMPAALPTNPPYRRFGS